MDLPAVGQNLHPVDSAAICIGVQDHVADLPDTKATVQEMLEGTADQIELMVRIAQCIDGIPLDFFRDGPVENTL